MRKTSKTIILFVFVLMMVSFLSLPVFSQGEEQNKKEKNGRTPTPTEIIARYSYDAKLTDYPPEVVRFAKYLILDNIGCILGACQTGVGKQYLRQAKNLGGVGKCTIPGSGEKVPWQTAAFISGQLANTLDFDDVYIFYFPAHPGIAIVPTALVFAELLGTSGEEMLTSVIVGYETSMHLGRAIGPADWVRTFIYPFPMGTAVVAAKLLHLDSAQTAEAMRQVGMYTSSNTGHYKFDVENNLTMLDTKNEAGGLAYSGILAAFRSLNGFESRNYFLDGDFEKWYMAGGSSEGYELLMKGPGKPYRIMETCIKPTPSCAFSHPAITALWAALDNHPVKEEDVQEIIFTGVVRLDNPKWDTMLHAQFSMYCALSLAALGVEPGPQWYVTGRFNDPDVRALAKKIKLVSDTEAIKLEIKENRHKAAVKVVFKDGTVKEATIYNVKGSPANPLTEEEIQAKFRANTRALFKESQITKIIDTVLNLEKIPRVSDLTRLLISRKLTY